MQSPTIGFFVSLNPGRDMAIWICTPPGAEFNVMSLIELGLSMGNVNTRCEKGRSQGTKKILNGQNLLMERGLLIKRGLWSGKQKTLQK